MLFWVGSEAFSPNKWNHHLKTKFCIYSGYVCQINPATDWRPVQGEPCLSQKIIYGWMEMVWHLKWAGFSQWGKRHFACYHKQLIAVLAAKCGKTSYYVLGTQLIFHIGSGFDILFPINKLNPLKSAFCTYLDYLCLIEHLRQEMWQIWNKKTKPK